MTRKAWVGLSVVLLAVLAAGCGRIEEPWKKGSAYDSERARSVEAQQALRERAREGMRDR